jgi:hypothetical protein
MTSRRAISRSSPRPEGQQRPAVPHPARRDRGDPLGVFRGRGRHRRDEHVQFDGDLPGRLWHGVARPGDERRRGRRRPGGARADKARGGGPGRPRFVAGAIGPLNRTLSMSPDVNRPDLPRRHLGPGRRRLPRAGAALAGRGRRRPPGRDDLRHPERQGRALCDRAPFRRDRRAAPGDDLGDDHRRLGPDALGPDDQRFYCEHRARERPSRSASTAPWAAGR